MEHVRVAIVTVPADEARSLARGIVEARMGACVNIVPKVTSFFWWEDEVKEEQEALLIVKTTQLKTEPLIKWVRENHPYEVPEIVTVRLSEGLPDYLNWVIDEMGKEAVV